MKQKLEEIRKMAEDLRHGVFHSEDTVNALIDGIVYRVDRLPNQDEAEMVEGAARALCQEWGYSWDGDPETDDQVAPEKWQYPDERPDKQLFLRAAKAALRAVGMIGGQNA